MLWMLVFLTIALPIAAGKFLKWDMLGAIILGLSLYAVYRLPFLAAFVPILDAYFTFKAINNIKSTPSVKEIVTYIPIAIIWMFTLLWLFGVVLSMNDALITYYPIVHAILVLSLYGAYTIGEPIRLQTDNVLRNYDFTKTPSSSRRSSDFTKIPSFTSDLSLDNIAEDQEHDEQVYSTSGNSDVSKKLLSPSDLSLYLDNRSLRIFLDNVVVGQEHAKKEIEEEIVKLLRKQQALRTRSPILGTFFFVGPTGVGKTETAKAIADYFASMGYQFLRFDMGNFSDYHTASTLVGSPKGYIGSEEGGALTRPLMRNPRAVILFDEMEKAHPSLFKTFMALIDEGEIQEVSTGA
ncbi:MAG: AAA family ATPase, partial [bacterium]